MVLKMFNEIIVVYLNSKYLLINSKNLVFFSKEYKLAQFFKDRQSYALCSPEKII